MGGSLSDIPQTSHRRVFRPQANLLEGVGNFPRKVCAQ